MPWSPAMPWLPSTTPSSCSARASSQPAVIGGGTPLDDAVAFAQWQTAHRLVERDAHTRLFNAAGLGLLDRVRDHLAATPSPEYIDGALWAACHGGQHATAELLLDHGADLNRPAPWDGLTPVDAARADEAGQRRGQGRLGAARSST